MYPSADLSLLQFGPKAGEKAMPQTGGFRPKPLFPTIRRISRDDEETMGLNEAEKRDFLSLVFQIFSHFLPHPLLLSSLMPASLLPQSLPHNRQKRRTSCSRVDLLLIASSFLLLLPLPNHNTHTMSVYSQQIKGITSQRRIV